MILNCRGLHYIAKNVNERVKLIPDELKDYDIDIIGLQEASGIILSEIATQIVVFLRNFLSPLVFRVRSISSLFTILRVIGIGLKPRDQSLTHMLMGLQQIAGATWCTNLRQRHLTTQVSTVASNDNNIMASHEVPSFPPPSLPFFSVITRPWFEPQVLCAARIFPKIWQLISDYCNTSPRKH